MAYKSVKKKVGGGLLGLAAGNLGEDGKNILGSLSPLYGAIAGKGAFGKLAGTNKEKENKARMAAEMQQQQSPTALKKGGRVRRDGVAQRGKTRGKMC
jgi:hypothetical protein